MIEPTVGRIVWIRNRTHAMEGRQPEMATIAFVNDDGTIHVGGFNHHGLPFAIHSVTLIQDDEAAPDGVHAEWMPYQKQLAAGEMKPTLHAAAEAPGVMHASNFDMVLDDRIRALETEMHLLTGRTQVASEYKITGDEPGSIAPSAT